MQKYRDDVILNEVKDLALHSARFFALLRMT